MSNINKSSKSMSYIMNPKNWWAPLTFILVISLLGVGVIGVQTYIDAPPMSAFVDEKNNMIFDQKTTEKGQEVFHKYALMEYGSYFGDGAQRGPDFTADALHQISQSMVKFYLDELKQLKSEGSNQYDVSQIEERVKAELKINRYDKASDLVRLSPAQHFPLQ